MFRQRANRSRRRGVTAVATVVLLPLMLGFAGLAIDVGMAYSVKADLQRAADAAALAGVRDLKGSDETSAMANSTATVLSYANSNRLFSDIPIECDPSTDIEFGQAMLDEATGKVSFLPNTMPPGACRVTVHAEVPYTFARIMGFESRKLSATAAASTGPRDFILVLDLSGSMTEQSESSEVEDDLDALGIYYDDDDDDDAIETALELTYDGSYPEYEDVYSDGELFLHPSVRIQPLKATKDAAAFAIQTIQDSGYDDLVGAVAYASHVDWVEELSFDYERVRTKILGMNRSDDFSTNLHEGMAAARQELLSSRSRANADKVLVLMTDGNSSESQALAEAQFAVDAGIIIHTIGLGSGVDQTLLDDIAALGGGLSLQISNGTDASVYGPELELVFKNLAEEVGFMLIQ